MNKITFDFTDRPFEGFLQPFEVLPQSRQFYIGDQRGAAVEMQRNGGEGFVPLYATRDDAEQRLREIQDAMEEDQ